MTVSLICVALLGILVFGLGLAVSLVRGRTSTGAGAPTDPTDSLYKTVRAHGNTTEYAAMFAILFLLVGSRDPGTWALGSIVGATLSRYLIVLGIMLSPTLARPHPLRFAGALGTYVFGLLLCLALFLSL